MAVLSLTSGLFEKTKLTIPKKDKRDKVQLNRLNIKIVTITIIKGYQNIENIISTGATIFYIKVISHFF